MRFRRRLLTEGIAIEQFSQLSDDADFQEACTVFKRVLKPDNDAKAKFNLTNLDIYKNDFEGFIEQVDRAAEYVNQRALDKAVRKAERSEGVDVLYDDPKCFIVSPKSAEYSNKAAYLDGGKANWCTAAHGDFVETYWELYNTRFIIYVYLKGKNQEEKDSWTMVLSNLDVYQIKRGDIIGDKAFAIIETRANSGLYGQNEEQMRVFDEMLAKTGLSRGKFYSILKDYLKNATVNMNQIIFDAIYENNPEKVKKVLEYGVDVNEGDEDGQTPIAYAAENNDFEIAEILLNAGADPYIRSNIHGYNAFDFADSYEMKEFLRNRQR